MSNDFDVRAVLNVAAFNAATEQLQKAMRTLQNSVAYVDLPGGVPEDESYSTAVERNSRYLAEMVSACFMAGISFTVNCDTVRGPSVDMYSEFDSRPVDEKKAVSSIGFPVSTAKFAYSIANAIADEIALSVKMRAGVESADYEIEVNYNDGHYVDHHTGELLAQSINELVTYCYVRNCEIAIVPNYD